MKKLKLAIILGLGMTQAATAKELTHYLEAKNCSVEKIKELKDYNEDRIKYVITNSVERVSYAIEQAKLINQFTTFSPRSAALQATERAFHVLSAQAGGFGDNHYKLLSSCQVGFVNYLVNEFVNVRPLKTKDQGLFIRSVIHALDNSTGVGTQDRKEVYKNIFEGLKSLSFVTKDDFDSKDERLNESIADSIRTTARGYLGQQINLYSDFDLPGVEKWLEELAYSEDLSVQQSFMPAFSRFLVDGSIRATPPSKEIGEKLLRHWIKMVPKLLNETGKDTYYTDYISTLVSALGDSAVFFGLKEQALEVMKVIVAKNGDFKAFNGYAPGSKERFKLIAEWAILRINSTPKGSRKFYSRDYDLRYTEKRNPYVIQFNP